LSDGARDVGASLHPAGPSSIGRRKLYAIGALVACLGLFAWTIVSRAMTRVALREQTIATATPTVATIRPQHGPADEELVLPGTVQAHNEAPNLRAHQRLPEDLVHRHRGARSARSGSGRDRQHGSGTSS